MPLPSFLQRKPEVPAKRSRSTAAEDRGSASPVEAARTRARRRLIGAVVLLAVGVIVFPLVFETQPRPVAVNVPIEVPARKDTAVAAAKPARPAPVPATAAEVPVDPPPAAAAPASAAGLVTPTPTPSTPATPPNAAMAASKPAAAVAKAEKVEPTEKVAKAEKAAEAERAKSLLEGKPVAVAPAASAAGRFVVQAGAYTDAAALREARDKIERLGLKTYTQVVETDAGRRTRVRIGPFASREEADRAAAKLKGAALPAAVLTL